MTMAVLRRIRSLTPTTATSELAPEPAAGVDITASAQELRPRDLPAHPVCPPTYTPGVCHHDGHLTVDGRRLGVLVMDGGRASWLPCHHSNRDGT